MAGYIMSLHLVKFIMRLQNVWRNVSNMRTEETNLYARFEQVGARKSLKYYVIIDLAPLKYLTASFRVYIIPPTQQSLHLYLTTILLSIVRSLSGKNWHDRYKAISISFPATPKDKLKCFWGCNEDIRKNLSSRGMKSYCFWNNGSECLFMSLNHCI